MINHRLDEIEIKPRLSEYLGRREPCSYSLTASSLESLIYITNLFEQYDTFVLQHLLGLLFCKYSSDHMEGSLTESKRGHFRVRFLDTDQTGFFYSPVSITVSNHFCSAS